MNEHEEKRYWLDDSRNVTKIFRALVLVCIALALCDLFYEKHVHFFWEEWFNFYGFYGFIGAFFLVLAAKRLRHVLMRREDYYD